MLTSINCIPLLEKDRGILIFIVMEILNNQIQPGIWKSIQTEKIFHITIALKENPYWSCFSI